MKVKGFLAFCKKAYKNSHLKVGMVIAILAIVGFSTVGQYGLTTDEPTELAMVRRNYELITKGQPIPGDLKYFGTVFNVTSEVIFQISQYIKNGGRYDPTQYQTEANDDYLKLKNIYDRIQIKHPLTFLVSLITYISVAGLVGILAGWEFAWLAPVVLALFPRFWGHSFFNPKDIPFAAIFTLCTLVGSYLVNYYINLDFTGKREVKKAAIYSSLYGFLVGILTGLRIGGFFMLFFVFIAHSLLLVGKGGYQSYKKLGKFVLNYGLMIAVWMVTLYVFHPAAWANPIGWFFETIGYLSKHPLQIKTLFEGKLYPIQNVPRYFTVKWLLITVPLIFQIFFAVGIIWAFKKYRKFSELQKAAFILILLQIFGLLSVAIIRGSSGYDDMRHFMFILPGMATLATTAMIWTYQSLSGKKYLQVAAVTFVVIVFAQILNEMIQLHPYQPVYFNRISGGLAAAQNRYETDYWGLSLREGMEWLNKNNSQNELILVGGNLYSAKVFADPRFTVIEYKPPMQKPAEPFYYLAWSRWGASDQFPECPVVHQVVRQGVALSTIKYCK